LDWFGNIFTFGCANSGCCAGDKDKEPVNRAEEMEWSGINVIEPK